MTDIRTTPQAHRDEPASRKLRHLAITVTLTQVLVAVYDLALLSEPPPLRDLLLLHLTTLVVSASVAVVCIELAERWRRAAPGMLAAGLLIGAATAAALTVATTDYAGDAVNGFVFRVIGGAVVGLATATFAVVVTRRHRRASRGPQDGHDAT